MKTRKIQTKIWRDSWFADLSRASKLLFIYLISNEHIGLSGFLELPDRNICFDTGLNQTELDQCKDELKDKVSFSDGWIYVKNLLKHDPIKGDKNNLWKPYEIEIESVPEKIKEKLEAPSKPLKRGMEGSIGIGKEKEKERNRKNSTKFSKITDLTNEHCVELAKHYKINPSNVFELREKLKLYCISNDKKYKNYSAALQTFIRNNMKG